MSMLLNQYVINWVNKQGGWKEILKNVKENKPLKDIRENIERLIENCNDDNIRNNTNKIWPTLICLLLMILDGKVQAEGDRN